MANISKPVGNNEQYAYNSFNDDHEEKVKAIIGELMKAGSSCAVCSSSQDLRNHYLREIVSNLFDDPRNSTVMRAPTDRESIVSAISSSMEEFSPKQGQSVTRTLWIYEAEFADEVESISLISKLVRQFEASGISLLVNCSGVVQRSQQFNRWIKKAKVTSEEFIVPTNLEISEFLDRADLEGGIYSARDLAAQLSDSKTSAGAERSSGYVSETKDHEEIEAEILSIPLGDLNPGKEPRLEESKHLGERTKLSGPRLNKKPVAMPRYDLRVATGLISLSLAFLGALLVWLFFGQEIKSRYFDFQTLLVETIGISTTEKLSLPADTLEDAAPIGSKSKSEVFLEDLVDPDTAGDRQLDFGVNNPETSIENPDLPRPNPVEIAPATAQEPTDKELFFLQAGAFSNVLNAQRFAGSNSGQSRQYEVVPKKSGLWAVVIGPLERGEAESLIGNAGITPLVLVAEAEYDFNAQGGVSLNER